MGGIQYKRFTKILMVILTIFLSLSTEFVDVSATSKIKDTSKGTDPAAYSWDAYVQAMKDKVEVVNQPVQWQVGYDVISDGKKSPTYSFTVKINGTAVAGQSVQVASSTVDPVTGAMTFTQSGTFTKKTFWGKQYSVPYSKSYSIKMKVTVADRNVYYSLNNGAWVLLGTANIDKATEYVYYEKWNPEDYLQLNFTGCTYGGALNNCGITDITNGDIADSRNGVVNLASSLYSNIITQSFSPVLTFWKRTGTESYDRSTPYSVEVMFMYKNGAYRDSSGVVKLNGEQYVRAMDDHWYDTVQTFSSTVRKLVSTTVERLAVQWSAYSAHIDGNKPNDTATTKYISSTRTEPGISDWYYGNPSGGMGASVVSVEVRTRTYSQTPGFYNILRSIRSWGAWSAHIDGVKPADTADTQYQSSVATSISGWLNGYGSNSTGTGFSATVSARQYQQRPWSAWSAWISGATVPANTDSSEYQYASGSSTTTSDWMAGYGAGGSGTGYTSTVNARQYQTRTSWTAYNVDKRTRTSAYVYDITTRSRSAYTLYNVDKRSRTYDYQYDLYYSCADSACGVASTVYNSCRTSACGSENVYSYGPDSSCGVSYYNTCRTSACGSENVYSYGPDSSCGVSYYKTCRTSGCGVESTTANSCANTTCSCAAWNTTTGTNCSACGSTTTTTYKSCANSACGTYCKSCTYNTTCAKYVLGVCTSWNKTTAANCSKCGSANNTCRTSACGVESTTTTCKSCTYNSSCKTYNSCANGDMCGWTTTYKSCANSACGVGGYNLCSYVSGTQYKSCSNSACGVSYYNYNSCRTSGCGVELSTTSQSPIASPWVKVWEGYSAYGPWTTNALTGQSSCPADTAYIDYACNNYTAYSAWSAWSNYASGSSTGAPANTATNEYAEYGYTSYSAYSSWITNALTAQTNCPADTDLIDYACNNYTAYSAWGSWVSGDAGSTNCNSSLYNCQYKLQTVSVVPGYISRTRSWSAWISGDAGSANCSNTDGYNCQYQLTTSTSGYKTRTATPWSTPTFYASNSSKVYPDTDTAKYTYNWVDPVDNYGDWSAYATSDSSCVGSSTVECRYKVGWMNVYSGYKSSNLLNSMWYTGVLSSALQAVGFTDTGTTRFIDNYADVTETLARKTSALLSSTGRVSISTLMSLANSIGNGARAVYALQVAGDVGTGIDVALFEDTLATLPTTTANNKMDLAKNVYFNKDMFATYVYMMGHWRATEKPTLVDTVNASSSIVDGSVVNAPAEVVDYCDADLADDGLWENPATASTCCGIMVTDANGNIVRRYSSMCSETVTAVSMADLMFARTIFKQIFTDGVCKPTDIAKYVVEMRKYVNDSVGLSSLSKDFDAKLAATGSTQLTCNNITAILGTNVVDDTGNSN